MIQQEMLEYQSIDRELNRIQAELRKNEFYQKGRQYKALKQNYEDSVARAETKANDLKTQLAVCRENMSKATAVIEEYYKELDDVEDLDELNYINRKLNEQLEVIAAIEKEIKRIARDGEETVKSIEDIAVKLPKIVSAIAQCNNEFNKAAEAQKPRVAELRQRQTALKQAIDPSVLEIYKKVSDGQIQPVFVPLKDGARCGGCQMEMPKAVVDAQFATKDYMRCEHCGRIIYKAE